MLTATLTCCSTRDEHFLSFLFPSKIQSVREDSIKLFVTPYLIFPMLTFVIDLFGVLDRLHNFPCLFQTVVRLSQTYSICH
jgi:hypothetical protein